MMNDGEKARETKMIYHLLSETPELMTLESSMKK